MRNIAIYVTTLSLAWLAWAAHAQAKSPSKKGTTWACQLTEKHYRLQKTKVYTAGATKPFATLHSNGNDTFHMTYYLHPDGPHKRARVDLSTKGIHLQNIFTQTHTLPLYPDVTMTLRGGIVQLRTEQALHWTKGKSGAISVAAHPDKHFRPVASTATWLPCKRLLLTPNKAKKAKKRTKDTLLPPGFRVSALSHKARKRRLVQLQIPAKGIAIRSALKGPIRGYFRKRGTLYGEVMKESARSVRVFVRLSKYNVVGWIPKATTRKPLERFRLPSKGGGAWGCGSMRKQFRRCPSRLRLYIRQGHKKKPVPVGFIDAGTPLYPSSHKGNWTEIRLSYPPCISLSQNTSWLVDRQAIKRCQ